VIHHVQLAAPPGTETELRSFWKELIGFNELEKPPALAKRGGCWFRRGDIEIHVGMEDDFRAARKAHPGLLVTALDVLADRLQAAGYPVSWDADFPGMRRFYTQDPFGNRLEFLDHVAEPPDA
jgi:hypothetical protein